MFRAFTILATVAALAVSAAPAWAGTPDAAQGACAVPGFMDYTDDSCMAKAGPRKPPGAMLGSRSGGEVVSDFAKSKPASLNDVEAIDFNAARKPPRTAQGVDCVDCLMTSFAVRQHDAGMHAVKAPPKPLGILDTGQFEHEWVKAPPKPRLVSHEDNDQI